MTEKDIKTANLSPDSGGWVLVDDLITGATIPLTRDLITKIVAAGDKQRFALSNDGQRIRANQGHSFPVDLGPTPLDPPETLFHGTATRFVDSIPAKGLIPGSRQHVHL